MAPLLALLSVLASPPVQRPATAQPPALPTAGELQATPDAAEPEAAPQLPAEPAATPTVPTQEAPLAATPAPGEPVEASEPVPVATTAAPPVRASPDAHRPVQPIEPLAGPALEQPYRDFSGTPGWQRDYVRVLPPRRRGVGWFTTTGLAAGSVLLKQATLWTACGDPGCGMWRVYDRAMILAGTGTAAAGAYKLGRHRAYHHALTGQARPNLRAMKLAGWITLGAGAALFATDIGLHAQCLAGNGPYVDPDGFFIGQCRGVAGTVMMDVGGAAMATGAGLASFSFAYARDRNVYDLGRVAVGWSPTRDGARLTVGGTF